MTYRLRQATTWYCFCTSFVLTAPSLAVDLEYGAGLPEERIAEVTSAFVADLVDPDNDNGSIDGAAGLHLAASESFSGIDDPIPPGLLVFSNAKASIFTDIGADSPTALIALATPGLAPPPPNVGDQVASGFSTQSDLSFESSLHGVSTTSDEIADPNFFLNPSAVDWVIDVLPSPGETAGSPTLVSIDTIVEGTLSATGNGLASASWLVAVNVDTDLISGSADLSDPLPFGGLASLDIVVPLGSSFKLRFLWELSTSGSGISSAEAEFTEASINLSATVIPEPSSLLLGALVGIGLMFRRRCLT